MQPAAEAVGSGARQEGRERDRGGFVQTDDVAAGVAIGAPIAAEAGLAGTGSVSGQEAGAVRPAVAETTAATPSVEDAPASSGPSVAETPVATAAPTGSAPAAPVATEAVATEEIDAPKALATQGEERQSERSRPAAPPTAEVLSSVVASVGLEWVETRQAADEEAQAQAPTPSPRPRRQRKPRMETPSEPLQQVETQPDERPEA